MERKEQVDLEYEEELQAIAGLRLLDDDLMTLVFDRNIEATELILSIILQRDDLTVVEAVAQREYKNPMAGGRSIKIDIYAVDSEEKVYDVEVQRASAGADAHRARFHSSMIDTKMLKENQKFQELHDSYVIFITEKDVVGAGLPMYHVERMFKETGVLFQDGSHIIYVNGGYKNNDDSIGKLMHDFRCTNSADMFYTVLAEPVKYFKETEGGRKIMSQTFEELANKVAERRAKVMAKAMAETMAQTMAETMAQTMAETMAQTMAEEKAQIMAETKTREEKKELVCRMLAGGKLTLEEIAEYADLPMKEVKELVQS